MELDSYKKIITSISEIEEQEKKYNNFKYYLSGISIIIGLVLIILYATNSSILNFLKNDSLSVFFEKETIGIFLAPLTAYLYSDFKEDELAKKRGTLIQSLDAMIDNSVIGSNLEKKDIDAFKELILQLLKKKIEL